MANQCNRLQHFAGRLAERAKWRVVMAVLVIQISKVMQSIASICLAV
jgi:hypothetical protein